MFLFAQSTMKTEALGWQKQFNGKVSHLRELLPFFLSQRDIWESPYKEIEKLAH